MNGYKILDFKGVKIEDGPTVEGLYKAIDESTKPFIITNANSNNVSVVGVKPYFAGIATKIQTGADTYGYVLPAPVIAEGMQKYMIINENDSITYNE